jgi:cell division septation protein DedD
VWAIQLGAAQERADAERLAAKFRRWQPRVEPAVVEGKGRWHRVRVAGFASREEAERVRKDIARATGVSGFVTGGR